MVCLIVIHELGLRTLCLSYRIIPKEEYQPWSERYMDAQSLIKDREKTMDAIAAEIEKDLVLMGATAIEDIRSSIFD